MRNRSNRLLMISTLGLALTAVTGAARADEPAVTPEGAPPDAAAPPAATTPAPVAVAAAAAGGPALTLHQGGIGIDGDLVIGLSSGRVGKPINIVPNIYYGVSDMLSVGLAHNPGAEVFQITGRGLCLTGTSGGCPKVYNNLSLDSLFSFSRSSTMDIAFHGGLDFLELSPDLFLSVRVGVKGKMLAGPLVIVFDPSLNIGATKRSAGNKEILQVPVRVGFMVTPQLNLGLSVGLLGIIDPPVGGFGDFYQIPLAVGGTFAISNAFDVRAQFGFPNLAGKGGTADGRTLSLGAAYHM